MSVSFLWFKQRKSNTDAPLPVATVTIKLPAEVSTKSAISPYSHERMWQVAQLTEVKSEVVGIVSPIKDKGLAPSLEELLLCRVLQHNTARQPPLILHQEASVSVCLDKL
jgi:hypothetical protein